MIFKLSKEQILNLLETFEHEATAGTYKRIPYSEWKYFKQSEELNIDFFSDVDVDVYRSNAISGGYAYFINDNSFGSFLYDYYKIDLEEANRMGETWWNYDGSSYNCISYDKANTDVRDYVTKSELDELKIKLDTKEDKKLSNYKENKNMFNFDFGPCSDNSVKMSIYGLAVKNLNGTYVSYDANNDSIMDVDIVNFDGAKYLYKMPVAIKDVKTGDIVIHNKKPVFVTKIGDNSKSLYVVDPVGGEKKEIMLTRSPFGFDFVTKIVNILGSFSANTASADNPFGNMWMLMLASGNNEENKFADLAPLMLMTQNGGNIDPMMMLLACGDRKDNLLPLVYMMNNNNTHTCHCNGKCNEAKED